MPSGYGVEDCMEGCDGTAFLCLVRHRRPAARYGVRCDPGGAGFYRQRQSLINGFIWLISPWISDISLRWFNKLTFLDDADVQRRFPAVHALMHDVANQYGFSAPSLGLIPDRNPTAFTYGLLRSNARIVVTLSLIHI